MEISGILLIMGNAGFISSTVLPPKPLNPETPKPLTPKPLNP